MKVERRMPTPYEYFVKFQIGALSLDLHSAYAKILKILGYDERSANISRKIEESGKTPVYKANHMTIKEMILLDISRVSKFE